MSHGWNEIENHWIKLRDKPKFDLSIPCIVINKDGDLFENTLKDLVSYINIPLNLTRELLFNYLSLTIEMGSEAAKQKKAFPLQRKKKEERDIKIKPSL